MQHILKFQFVVVYFLTDIEMEFLALQLLPVVFSLFKLLLSDFFSSRTQRAASVTVSLSYF